MAVLFKELLNKPADTIEKPKALPAGTYIGAITKYEFGESKEKKTPFVRFIFAVHSAGEDVDPDSLVGVDLSKKTLRRDFYLTDDALYRVKELMESCGHSTTGRTLGEIMPDMNGTQVMLEVTQRSSQDGSEVYNDVGNVKGV